MARVEGIFCGEAGTAWWPLHTPHSTTARWCGCGSASSLSAALCRGEAQDRLACEQHGCQGPGRSWQGPVGAFVVGSLEACRLPRGTRHLSCTGGPRPFLVVMAKSGQGCRGQGAAGSEWRLSGVCEVVRAVEAGGAGRAFRSCSRAVDPGQASCLLAPFSLLLRNSQSHRGRAGGGDSEEESGCGLWLCAAPQQPAGRLSACPRCSSHR